VNVGIVKLSALGDVVHALPVAAALRQLVPTARITWVVEQRQAPVLRGHPALDNLVVVDMHAWRTARRAGDLTRVAREIGAVRRRLRDARLDVVLDLQGNVKSGALTCATRAPLRIGFAARFCQEPLNAVFTNRHVAPPPSAAHVVDQCLALLAPLGARAEEAPVEFHLPYDPVAEQEIEEFFGASGLKPRDRLVVLNPGASRARKRWPVERFAELATRLATDDAARVLVVWGPGEESLARPIVDAGRRGRTVLAPATDLHALMSLLRRASVMVSADSGPLHLAAALGVACVGLFGPTSSVRNGPYGKGHRTVESADGTLEAIGVAPVVRAVSELLA